MGRCFKNVLYHYCGAVAFSCEGFSFVDILLTSTESLIPRRLGHYGFAGQVLCYLRICSHLCYAINKIRSTSNILNKQGYHLRELRLCIEKLLNKHFRFLLKFGLFSSSQLS